MTHGTLADQDRKPPVKVSCRNDRPIVFQDQDRGGSIDLFLGVADPFRKGLPAVDQRRYQLCGIDLAAGHGFVMAADLEHMAVDQFLCVIDHADNTDRKNAEACPDQQRLRIAVVDTADRRGSLHIFKDMLELGPERRIVDLVDLPLKTDLFVIRSDAAGLRSEMGMVVHSEKHFVQAIFFCCYSKKSTHKSALSFFLFYIAVSIFLKEYPRLSQGPSQHPLPFSHPASQPGTHPLRRGSGPQAALR